MKKVLLYFFGFVFLLLIALATAPYLFSDKIKAKLLKEIDSKIDAEFTFSDFSFSSFRNFPHMTVVVHDFCLTGKEDFAGDTLAYAERVSVSFEYYSLVKDHDMEIKRIALTKPYVNMRTLSNGDHNYDIFLPDTSRADTSRFKVNIEQWIIEDGKFVMYDRPQRSFLMLNGINHTGNGDFTQDVSDLNIATSVEEITYSLNGIKYMDRKRFNTDMVVEMNLKERKFSFKDHVVEINHFKFGFDGYLKFPSEGYEVDLKLIVTHTDFKNFLSIMPGFYVDDFKTMKVTGEFTLEGHVKGIYDYAHNRIPTFALDLKVKNGSFKYNHLPKPMENIFMDFVFTNTTGNPDNTVFDIRDFRFDIDKSPVSGKLKITGMKDPDIQADVKIDVDVAEIEKLHPIDGITLRGNLWSEIKVNGTYSKEKNKFPIIDAKLVLDSGYIKSKDYAFPMENIHLNAEVVNTSGKLTDTRIRFDTMTYRIDGEPFRMKGSLSNMADYTYDLTVKGTLEFEKLTKLFPIAGMTLTGSIDLDVKSSGKLSDLENRRMDSIKTRGDIEIRNVTLIDKELPQSISIIDAKLHVGRHRVVLKSFSGKIGNSTFSLKGHLFEYMPLVLGTGRSIKGDLELVCDTLDLNALFASPAAAARDTAASSLEVVEIPSWIEFKFDAKIDYVHINQLTFQKLVGEIKIKDQVLTLNETGFTSQGGKFLLTGDYDTHDMKHPSFETTIQIDTLDIVKGFEIFQTEQNPSAMPDNTDGVFSTKYYLKGEFAKDFTPILSTLTGKGTIIVEDAQIKGMKVLDHVDKLTKKSELQDARIQDIVMETEIKEGKVFIKPFSFQVGKYFAELEGSHSFDNTLNYVMVISRPPLKKIRIPFHISGTVDKPVVKLGKGHEKFDFTDF